MKEQLINMMKSYNVCSGWVCEKYSASIENNVLKTFGSQKLEYIQVGDIPFRFNEDVEGSAYITTNE